MIRIFKKAALPLLLGAALLTVSTTGCKVTKTQDGKMPERRGEHRRADSCRSTT